MLDTVRNTLNVLKGLDPANGVAIRLAIMLRSRIPIIDCILEKKTHQTLHILAVFFRTVATHVVL